MVDGDDALRLKVTLKDGDIIYYYLDPDTFLEIRKEVTGVHSRVGARERGRDGLVQARHGRHVSLFDFAGIEGESGAQTTTIEKIEVNVNINPADFAVPASLRADEKKSGLVGFIDS